MNPLILVPFNPDIDQAYRLSFETQKDDHRHFYHQRTIVLLIGTSSAGKTTILNAVRALQPDRADLGVDLYFIKGIYQFLNKNHRRFGVSDERWEHFQNVLISKEHHLEIHDTYQGRFTFKPGISIADQNLAKMTAYLLKAAVHGYEESEQSDWDKIETQLLDRALGAAMKGQNVIADLILTSAYSNHLVSKLPFVRSVFVYCPMHALVDHIADRNNKAISGEKSLNEVRAGAYPLLQFAELIRPKNENDPASDVIERLTKKEVEELYEKNFESCTKVLEKINPLDHSLEETKEKEKAELLHGLGFKRTDPDDKLIEYVPKLKLNGRINTDDRYLGHSPILRAAAAAKKILHSL